MTSIYRAYTLTPGRTDTNVLFYGGPYTVTLCDAVQFNSKVWILTSKTKQTITLATIKGQLIDNSTTLLFKQTNQTATITSNGANWVPTYYSAGSQSRQRTGDGQIVNVNLPRIGTV